MSAALLRHCEREKRAWLELERQHLGEYSQYILRTEVHGTYNTGGQAIQMFTIMPPDSDLLKLRGRHHSGKIFTQVVVAIMSVLLLVEFDHGIWTMARAGGARKGLSEKV